MAKKSSSTEHNLDTWYQQTVTKLYRFTYALLQNREEAEDITQETYFRCLKKDPENYPSYPYLKQIARNLIYDRYRHWKVINNQTEDHSLSDDVPTIEENWVTRALVTNSLLIPQGDQGLPNQPSVRVEIDMDVVKRNQQQVDAGSSPWQLDPKQVAFTFAALQISPTGIKGDPPIGYDTLNVTTNTGTDAVILISEGPVKVVYVKRLIRQDQSGIWTVVGFDLR